MITLIFDLRKCTVFDKKILECCFTTKKLNSARIARFQGHLPPGESIIPLRFFDPIFARKLKSEKIIFYKFLLT